MDIHKTSDNGATLKLKEATIAVNQPRSIKKVIFPSVILNSFNFEVKGYSEIIESNDEYKVFSGAGEYEKEGVLIKGYENEIDDTYNTNWLIKGENLTTFIATKVKSKKDLQHMIADVNKADVLILFINKEGLSATDVGSIVSSIQVKKIILIGDDSAKKNKIVKEVEGEKEEAKGKCSVKAKDLANISIIFLD